MKRLFLFLLFVPVWVWLAPTQTALAQNANGVITNFTIVGADPGSNGTVKTINSGESVVLKMRKKEMVGGGPRCETVSSTSSWVAHNFEDGKDKFVTTHNITRDTVFTLTCFEEDEWMRRVKDVGVAKVTVKIRAEQPPAPKPEILEFAAESERVKVGSPVVLRWKTANADRCGISARKRGIFGAAMAFWGRLASSNDFSLPANSDGMTITEKLDRTTKYTLQCLADDPNKEGGVLRSGRKTITVVAEEVRPKPQITELSLSHPEATDNSGDTITLPAGAEKLALSWRAENADGCRAELFTADGKKPTGMDATVDGLFELPSVAPAEGFVFPDPIKEPLRIKLICYQEDNNEAAVSRTMIVDLQRYDDGGCVVGQECQPEEKKLSLSVTISSSDGTDSQTVSKGGEAKFKVKVTNNGEAFLEDLVVNSNVGSCERTSAQTARMYEGEFFDPNESIEYECSLKNVLENTTVSVTVTAKEISSSRVIGNIYDTTKVTANTTDTTDTSDDRSDEPACSEEISVRTAYDRADLVFSGRVVRVKKVGRLHPARLSGYEQEVILEISETDRFWKGDPRPRVFLRVKKGTSFREGQRYLVYADYRIGAFGYATSVCARTALYEKAQSDIAKLNRLIAEEPKAEVNFVKSVSGKTELLPEKITAKAGEIMLAIAGRNVNSCQLVAENEQARYNEKKSDVDTAGAETLIVYTLDIAADGKFRAECLGAPGSDKAGRKLIDTVEVKVEGTAPVGEDEGRSDRAEAVFVSGTDDQGRPVEAEEMTATKGESISLSWLGRNVRACALYRSPLPESGRVSAASVNFKIKEVAEVGAYTTTFDSPSLYTLRCLGAPGSDKADQVVEDTLRVISPVERDREEDGDSEERDTSEPGTGGDDQRDDGADEVVCTDQYEPVCARLSNGRYHTFANACMAGKNRAEILFTGICGQGGQNGDQNCPPVADPQCAAGEEFVPGGVDEQGCPQSGTCRSPSSTSADVNGNLVSPDPQGPAEEPPSDVAEVFIPCAFVWPDTLTDKFAHPKNVFSEQGEPLASVRCTISKKVTVTAGGGDENHYTWKKAYYTEDGSSFGKSIQLQGKTDSSGNWIIGPATATFRFTAPDHIDNYLATYTCVRVGDEWKCGCRNREECSDPAAGKTIWYLSGFNLSRRYR